MDRQEVHLTRKIEVSSAHSYTLDALSPAEREATFGKSAATHAHGHNYDIRVTVAGPIDENGDWVINIKEIDRIMREKIEEQLDHRHINIEVPKLCRRWPTLETLATFVWEEMAGSLEQVRLEEVQLFENPDFFAEYRGEGSMIYLTRVYRFSAAHRLHNPALSDEENRAVFGKCNNPHGHGHDYVLEVTLKGHPDPKTDCLIDIGLFDSLIQKEILQRFDHVHLNLDTEEFRNLNPSSENMVMTFWKILDRVFPESSLHRLRLWETSRSYFDYFGPGADSHPSSPARRNR